MDAQATPDMATSSPSKYDDWTLIAQATLEALWARAKPAIGAAFAFGSPGNMVFAALLGAGAFLLAALAGPMDAPAEASPPASPAPAAGLTEAALALPGLVQVDPMAPAPVGTAPTAAIDNVLDYAVVYFWPATPQTVAEPAAIRDGPSGGSKLIRAARPGERLRINGKVEDAPGGPWLRVRLADGKDGYFAARTVDVGVFRRRRAIETEAAAMADDPAFDAVGAPLIVDRTVSEESEIGPPSF